MKYKVTNNTENDITLTDLNNTVIDKDDVNVDLLLNNDFAMEDLLRSDVLQTNIASGNLTAKDNDDNVIKTFESAHSKSIISYMNVSGAVVLSGFGSSINSHHVKVNGNATLSFTNIPDDTVTFLMLEQDATGGYTITLPTFDNLDTQPVVSTTASKMDNLIIMKMNGEIHLHSYIRFSDTF